MPVGNLQSAAGQLKEATENLMVAWERVREAWVDENSREFGEDYIQPVFEAVNAAMPAINQMSTLLQTARRSLEE